MEIVRSARVRIGLEREAAEALISAYTFACNFASRLAFSLQRPSNALELQRVAYEAVREQFGLSAQVAVSACRAVSAKYAALKKLKQPPKEPIRFPKEPVQLQGGERGRDFRFAGGELSITTLSGRVKVKYHGPPRLKEYLASWELGGALLQVKKNKVYLLVSFKKEVEERSRPNNAVIGVDRGIKQIAVATDGKASRFFGGGHTVHKRAHYQRVKASLQSRKAHKSTRSLRRLQTRFSGREQRFKKDVDHTVSKRIVEFAEQVGCPTLALENLKGIRDRVEGTKEFRRLLGGWSFYRLEGYIGYKAAERGFAVLLVDPKNTSKGCSRCGHTESANRKGLTFLCKACSFRLHADLNGGRNLRLRGILARQAPGQDGLPVSAPSSPGFFRDKLSPKGDSN